MSEEKERSFGEQLKEKLLRNQKSIGEAVSDEEIADAGSFCEGYKDFLNECKTEREAVEYMTSFLKKNGFSEFECDKQYTGGSKVYRIVHGKALIVATIGRRPVSEGVRIVASHIDSPRLDLKPNPLYENGEIAYFKTHYYGGIKKYQWSTVPLALHGVVAKKDGTVVKVKLGEDKEDPVFCVSDLLVHLAGEQMKRPLSEGIKGEELNIIIGSYPFKDEKISDKVKLNVMRIIFEKYGITEEDFLSAELTAVPAFHAADVGFDRSMIGSYGHDDRVCAYTSFMAAVDCEDPEFTCVTVMADKEEIGSEGNTGMASNFLLNFIDDLAACYGEKAHRVLEKSYCMSADVNAAFDPTFPDVSEKNNCAKLGYGIVITKYTGARGKSGTNDASAETVAFVRRILDNAGVIWQTGELGKVDAGGGGTVAMYIANLGPNVVDAGVPVLSMHAPFEIVSKLDVYSTYQGFKSFLDSKMSGYPD